MISNTQNNKDRLKGLENVIIRKETLEHKLIDPNEIRQKAETENPDPDNDSSDGIEQWGAEFSKWAESVIDDFDQSLYDSSSEMGKKVHVALRANKLMNTTHVDSPSLLLSAFYKSKADCKEARKKALTKAYTKATDLFDANSPSSLAQEAAKAYGGQLCNTK